MFPVDLADAEEKVEEKLKVQRLNVGFSRAEEMIWFVTSKPIADFIGSIARVLNHYNNLLLKGDVPPDRTDANSPMEAKVLDWLQKTPFYQQHRESVEILPQFPIGDYLRQLDPTYKHPAWRVDFLVTFLSDQGMARIVIEYDGFEHHFQKGKEVNIGSHERYLLEADVERQLTLESYGYRFLRINRFNLGKDPVQTLSDRLTRLVEKLYNDNEVIAVEEVQAMAGGKIDYLDMSLWDVRKEPEDDKLKGRSLLSYFAELPRGPVRLGAAGKVMTAQDARDVLDAGCDFVVIGRAAILRHDFPERVRRDPAYRSPPLPASVPHLLGEGLSDEFVHYMRRWPGFVEEEVAG